MKGRAPFATVPGEPSPPRTDPIALLNYALQRHPESVSLVNFAAQTELSVFEPGPAIDGHVLVTICMPENVATNLAGPPEQQDAYILIHIGRATLDAMDEEARKPSLILVPPGIVRPS